MAELSVFATSILSRVGTFAVEYAINDIKLACNVRSELEKLKNSLKAICAVLKDAERKQSTSSSLKHWLENLKDVVYDIDDVLDDVGTRALQQKVGKGEIGTYFTQLCIFPFELGRKIRKVRERLNEIAALKTSFSLIEEPIDTPSDEIVQRETHSIVDERRIVGRDKAKNEIVKMISESVDSNSDTLSVLPIIGMGGVGKTALAKLVFNDKRTKEKFDKMLWACVSNVFDQKHIIDIIIQSDSGESNKQLTLEALQRKLHELLSEKRYLLVLDDISHDNTNDWEELINLLPSGRSGSMVLITTRLSKVASVLKTIEPYEVPKLPDEECMKVFVRYAFRGEKTKDTELLKIGESIVQKCDGLPLAARALGSLLSTKDIAKWQEVKEKKLPPNDIMSVLKVSYDALPSDLRACFSSLSTFPKDYEIFKELLIMYWMAMGLLGTSGRSKEAIKMGETYFSELAGRSLFQDYVLSLDGNVSHCKMHSLVHDLAISVSQNEHATISCENFSASKRVKHLVWDQKDDFSTELKFPKQLRRASKARTFASRHNYGTVSKSFLEDLLATFTRLRILVFSEVEFEELPSSIGNLKHLRYLDLQWNMKIKFLPNSLCKLVNLQTLQLAWCKELEELPKDVQRLVSLRYLILTSKQQYLPKDALKDWTSMVFLQISACPMLTSLTEGFGGLSALRELFVFNCPKLPSLPSSMNRLVTLQKLIIHNCDELDLSEPKEAMGGLKSLESIELVGLPKFETFPDSFESASSSLKYLKVSDCKEFKKLPDFIQRFSSLKKIEIPERHSSSSITWA
uniref:Uncharacterized protein n=1 Tax=Leersia perrieri TaxID=77586 RepID=A0A0D9XZ88_9ORYZ